MGSLKKFDGSSWINSNLRKLTTDTDTFTTFPAIIYAEGTNATVGLKGNTVQNGTPTPDNPIMPEGTGERTGQLIDYTLSESGGIDGSGNYATANNLWRSTAYTPIDETLQYVVSWTANTNLSVVRINYYTSDKTHIIREQINTPGTALTIPQNAAYLKWTLYAKTDFIIDLSFVQSLQLMINTGSTALPYEPYGYKIPISSANTTTPVYLGEVETTRKIRKLVLTGEENITSGHLDINLFNIPVNDYLKQSAITCISTHYISQSNVNGWADVNDKSATFYGNTGSATKTMYIRDSAYTTVADFKAYLAAQYAAGTPVTVWYVLAEPETAVVNEPLMRIGDYADTVSGISIPVTAGGDTLSVGTTVQPSEVTANYYGWHTITVHERESGQWD